MRAKVTADDIVTAVDAMEEKKAKWEEEHPEEPMPLCPICKNTGLIRRAYDENGVELFGEDKNKAGAYDYFYPCKCVSLEKSHLLRNNKKFATLPVIYDDATFDNFETQIYHSIQSKQLATYALKDAIRYVLQIEKWVKKGMGLYIYSEQKGSGKTRLASSIANELMMRGIRVKFESANRILMEIQRTWNSKTMSEADIIDRYIAPQILFIDDIGARGSQSWIDDKFLAIIDERYSKNKVTIFTSNHAVDDLPFENTRTLDRIAQPSRTHQIKMPNESVRRIESEGKDPFYED